MERIIANASGLIRNEKMEGREYTVVPMVMMVEGVLDGSNGPLFYPGEEMAKFPQVWNHKPVVVYHPTMNGKALSACDPEIISSHKIGVIMNTKWVKKGRKLTAEAWLDPERMAIVDNRVQDALTNNTMMELSTGLFTENEETPGMFGEKPYDAIARNHRPDHLAILPDEIGACSIEDGAGFLRVNTADRGELKRAYREIERALVTNEVSHAAIRDQLREALPKSESEMVWIEDVFDSHFIFEKGSLFFRQDYSLKEDVAKPIGVPTQVTRKIIFEDVTPVTNRKGEVKMNREKIVDEIIANTAWAAEDREFLLGLEEDKLTKLLPVQNNDGGVEEEDANAPAKKVEDDNDQPQTAEEFIANAPAEIREVLSDSLQTHAQRKAGLIEQICANKKNVLTKDQLSAMSINELSAVAILAKVEEEKPTPNYFGMAPVDNSGGEKEDPLIAPVMNFGKEE